MSTDDFKEELDFEEGEEEDCEAERQDTAAENLGDAHVNHQIPTISHDRE